MAERKKYMSGLVYGRSGTGKTMSLVGAFPTAAFIGPRGSITCASYYGIDLSKQLAELSPNPDDPKKNQGMREAADLIPRLAKKFDVIVIADLTVLADFTLGRLEATTNNKYKIYGQYQTEAYNLLDAIITADAHVWVDMHEQDPRTAGEGSKATKIPGGPKIGGWQLPATLPGRFEFIARMVWDEDIGITWPYVYQTGPDEDFVTKDRYNVSPQSGRFPPNLGELMRAAGYDIPRHSDIPDMEAHVERVALKLTDVLKSNEDVPPHLVEFAKELLPILNNQRYVRWILKDGLERALLRREQANLLKGFIARATVS